jgi:hypothetical protein
MYLYLNSSSSDKLFNENKAASFVLKLPRRLDRKEFTRGSIKDGWEVALVDLRTPRFVEGKSCESLAIFCHICDVSVYENDMSPIMLTFHRPNGQFNTKKPVAETITTPRYIRVTDHTIEYIKIYILDESGNPPPFEDGSLRCTLHLRPCHDQS